MVGKKGGISYVVYVRRESVCFSSITAATQQQNQTLLFFSCLGILTGVTTASSYNLSGGSIDLSNSTKKQECVTHMMHPCWYPCVRRSARSVDLLSRCSYEESARRNTHEGLKIVAVDPTATLSAPLPPTVGSALATDCHLVIDDSATCCPASTPHVLFAAPLIHRVVELPRH
jgi:hypothetical protein